MTARNGIVCVEWCGPVPVRAVLPPLGEHRHETPCPRLNRYAGGRFPNVYLIEEDGAPLYVGCTNIFISDRLTMHRNAGRPLGSRLKKASRGECEVTVRWSPGGTALEAQLIWTLQPRYNVRHREVPTFPLRRAALPKFGEMESAAARMSAAGLSGTTIADRLGVNQYRVGRLLQDAAPMLLEIMATHEAPS